MAIECERASVIADHQEVTQLYSIGREVIGKGSCVFHCRCPFLTRRVRFMLEACEFLRVGNDTNRLNTLCLHLNGEDEQGLTTSADDDSRLTVDFRSFHLMVLWQKAHRSQAKACHRITPTNGMQRGL